MATSNQNLELDKQLQQNQQTGNASTTGGAPAVQAPAVASASTTAPGAATQAATAAAPASYTGIAGVSEGTAQKLAQYQQGYQQSQAVTDAQNYLQSIVDGKPADYASSYQDQLKGLYDQIMNRKQFSYDLNGDMLYKQYAEQYQRLGRNAMQDTMGQAAAMTGGYGSSYATTAGNQAYQSYLQQLNDRIPELYQQALNAYNAEGDRLTGQFNLTNQMEQNDYGRYRDALNDWQNERAYAQSAYQDERNFDYSDYSTMLNYYNQLASQENASYQAERNYAYSFAMNMLNQGLMPDGTWLELAGISKGDAQEIVNAHVKKSSGGGGSSKKSSSGSGTPKSSGGLVPLTVAAVTGNAAAGKETAAAIASMLSTKTPAYVTPTGTSIISQEYKDYLNNGKSKVTSFLK